MAVTARISLNLSAAQTLPSDSFVAGGVNYGLNGLDQAFSGTEVEQVFVQEFALAANVETALDLSDMSGATDALGAVFAAGSVVAVVVQVASGLVSALTQHVLVRGLGAPSNEVPVESDATRVGLALWTYPGGCPVRSAPELRFESLNGTSTVAVFVLVKSGAGATVPDRRRFVTYEARHVSIAATAGTRWFFPIPIGHLFTLVRSASLTEDATLAVGGTSSVFAIGRSADGIAATAEWMDDLTPDATARYEASDADANFTTTSGDDAIYLEHKTASGNAKDVTILITGYLTPE